ncbi:targeting protein for Xklp2 [Platysternon megacephalum]|uniref:Targeting protein for Xklp2 n=1 Tax=Platysternon megacephalum TaxID=55544 RepID=A0A4D9DVL0_9SAUR|nr:targeting protein for Xklp2 [Platysternon megacephalum]
MVTPHPYRPALSHPEQGGSSSQGKPPPPHPDTQSIQGEVHLGRGSHGNASLPDLTPPPHQTCFTPHSEQAEGDSHYTGNPNQVPPRIGSLLSPIPSRQGEVPISMGVSIRLPQDRPLIHP